MSRCGHKDCSGFLVAGIGIKIQQTRRTAMPRKPRKLCAAIGCPNLTDGRYCVEHAKAEHKRYNRYQRDPQTSKRYGTEWKKIRTRYLLANPLCELCKDLGRLTPATLVHHKRKLSEGGNNDWVTISERCRCDFPCGWR